MQKIIVLMITIALFLSFTNASLSSSTKKGLDMIIQNIEQSWSNLSKTQQEQNHKNLITKLQAYRPKLANSKKEVVDYIVEQLGGQVNNEIPYTIPNVDIDKVMQARINWHNEIRTQKGLPPFQQNTKLDYSAYQRANHVSDLNYSTHKRLSSDGYYNYQSIKNRFTDQGVTFNYAGTAFTENIAYNYYKCTKSDCTQDLINAIRKGFDFFMSEESWNGAHYRAIVHPYLTDIGLGIAFNGDRYRLVSHYGINVE